MKHMAICQKEKKIKNLSYIVQKPKCTDDLCFHTNTHPEMKTQLYGLILGASNLDLNNLPIWKFKD